MQQALNISPTVFTPEVIFDPNQNIFSVKGRSYPENVAEFYKPVFKWMDDFLNLPVYNHNNISVNFEVDYLNSTTLKLYYELAKVFKEFNERSPLTKINWVWKLESNMDENMIENIKAIETASNFEILVVFDEEASN